jgi:hypothetical protein
MKSITKAALLSLLTLAANNVLADSPNMYDLRATNLHITYSTSGLDGQPHLTYTKGNKTIGFSGEEIRAAETHDFTIVTVTTVITADTGRTTFSFLIPTVNMDYGETIKIKTQGFTTKSTFSPVPQSNHGQMDTYAPVVLTGTAKIVRF